MQNDGPKRLQDQEEEKQGANSQVNESLGKVNPNNGGGGLSHQGESFSGLNKRDNNEESQRSNKPEKINPAKDEQYLIQLKDQEKALKE